MIRVSMLPIARRTAGDLKPIAPPIKAMANRYLEDLPPAVISLVHQFASLDLLEKWLDRALGIHSFGGRFSEEAYNHLIAISLLFGFESKPDRGLTSSMGSMLRNWRIDEKDQQRIWRAFYDPKNYLNEEELGEVADKISLLLSPLKGWPDYFLIFDRIKQYGSLTDKMRKAVALADGPERAAALTVSRLISRASKIGKALGGQVSELLDDILGFNFIINDTGLDETTRAKALTNYTEQVRVILEAQTAPRLKLTLARKPSRTPGFEAVNLFINGWLIHQSFGDLPIKIQFRFKTALYGESAMYYGYKKYGRWEFPPWAANIDLGQIGSFRELQIRLFDNFKKWSAGRIPSEAFSLREYLTLPADSFFGQLNAADL